MLVVLAAAGFAIEQPAADVGVVGAVGALLHQLVQAAAAAAVAQAFPFGLAHVLHGLALPEREVGGVGHCLVSSSRFGRRRGGRKRVPAFTPSPTRLRYRYGGRVNKPAIALATAGNPPPPRKPG